MCCLRAQRTELTSMRHIVVLHNVCRMEKDEEAVHFYFQIGECLLFQSAKPNVIPAAKSDFGCHATSVGETRYKQAMYESTYRL